MGMLVDTNVISELMRVAPDQRVLNWMSRQPVDDLHVSAVTVGELMRGILRLPQGKRRDGLLKWWQVAADELISGVISFDEPVAVAWAAILADGERSGTPVSAIDAMLAATAKVHGLTVCTRNTKDFERTGVAVINPWEQTG